MLTLFGCVALIDSVLAADTSPAELQALYEKLAGRSADAAKGKKFFTTAYANDTTCANLSRSQILSQAGSAMLAQANQLPHFHPMSMPIALMTTRKLKSGFVEIAKMF